MTLEEYRDHTKVWEQPEPRRAELVCYYFSKFEKHDSFNMNDVLSWYSEFGLPEPNKSRLGKKIRQSRKFMKTGSEGLLKFHPAAEKELAEELALLVHNPKSMSRIGSGFIDKDRLESLRAVLSEKFDFSRLVRLCEELDFNFLNQNYLTVGILIRAILDHIPPVFGVKSFSEVANNYAGSKSFKSSMKTLENLSRDLSDSYLHTQIRKRETLPNSTQVDFSQPFDALLEEIIRISEPNNWKS